MSNLLKIGHLAQSQESLISSIPVKEAQVVYSENSGMQFIDYANKRHTYGSVLSGIYNDTFVDFGSIGVDAILTAIKTNGLVNNGQLIKSGNKAYQYRKINSNNFIAKLDDCGIDMQASKAGYAIYIPGFVSGDYIDIDLLISVYNETQGDKLFFVKVENNVVDLTACEDMDGTFDSSTFPITISHNGSGLFTISVSTASIVKVVSYTVSSTGSSSNEAFYIASSDLA